jgi:hypothetical protein
MTAPDATFTNGRYELPPHARGVLVLADPPEAGWRLQPTANEPAITHKPLASCEGSDNPVILASDRID